jgi:hypothetical protein
MNRFALVIVVFSFSANLRSRLSQIYQGAQSPHFTARYSDD